LQKSAQTIENKGGGIELCWLVRDAAAGKEEEREHAESQSKRRFVEFEERRSSTMGSKEVTPRQFS